MPVSVRRFYTEDEFLILERMSKTKNEYYRGEIFAMCVASYQHNQITSSLMTDIGSHLKAKPCKIFGSDLRVHTQLKTFYTYPDAVFICGEPSFIDNEFDTIINPAILFEILSPSTETYDRTIKFDFYKNIYSLKQYVLIDSQKMLVEVFTKQSDQTWLAEKFTDSKQVWALSTIEYTSTVEKLYEGVIFKKV